MDHPLVQTLAYLPSAFPKAPHLPHQETRSVSLSSQLPLFYQRNYSGTNKDSYALNFGISATFSIPLDRGFQNQCKSAADTQISIQKQVLENKRLDWQIARIRECGKLKQEGIMLTTDSPFFNICKDVYLVPKANQVIPHTHKLK